MADGSGGMGGGPLDPQVVGWLWGFLFGVIAAAIGCAITAYHFGAF